MLIGQLEGRLCLCLQDRGHRFEFRAEQRRIGTMRQRRNLRPSDLARGEQDFGGTRRKRAA
jgi:hypothetical protein